MASQRRTILINRKFQTRFALYVCSWIFALSLIYPIIISNLYDSFARYMALDPHGPPIALLEETRHRVLIWLVILQVVFLFAIFLISVFLSHRIAGPLYKLNRFFQSAKDGNFRERLFFRKGDHFQELAASYNEMVDSMRATRIQALSHVEKALAGASGETKIELERAAMALKESGS